MVTSRVCQPSNEREREPMIALQYRCAAIASFRRVLVTSIKLSNQLFLRAPSLRGYEATSFFLLACLSASCLALLPPGLLLVFSGGDEFSPKVATV